MPEFKSPFPVSELEKAARKSRLDLSPYTEYLKSLKAGFIGKVELGEEEKKETVKNHVRAAAKQMDLALKFRRSDEKTVLFERKG